MKTCIHCGQQLPDECFERYPSGTHRRVCRACKYLLYGVKAKRKWRLRHLCASFAND
ncbi:MAG: hypothetical protein IKR31_07250 [Prevotella sp.]|nr:hypothetical protein [Prevotella sp.]